MNVLIIFTGGTISMIIDRATGGAIPSLSGAEILERIDGVSSLANVEVVEFGKYPGPHVTPAMMYELAGITQKALDRDDIDGVIITHGTDTLEETAYFLDLSLDSPKPVVVIGSMSHSDDPDWDGPQNVIDAVKTIASGRFRNVGVLTCLSGELNAASEVTKTHTLQRDTFMSFDFGPVGTIQDGAPVFLRTPAARVYIGLAPPKEPVHLIKCYAGMDATFFEASILDGTWGIVVEAMGTGNVPPPAYDGIVEVLRMGIPVVLVSRCPVGSTDDVYGYYGAGRNLRKAGVIFAKYLNGQKARLKLMLALGKASSTEELVALLEEKNDRAVGV